MCFLNTESISGHILLFIKNYHHCYQNRRQIMAIPDGNLKQTATGGKKEEIQSHHQIKWIMQNHSTRNFCPKVILKNAQSPILKLSVTKLYNIDIRSVKNQSLQNWPESRYKSKEAYTLLKLPSLSGSLWKKYSSLNWTLGFQSSYERFQSQPAKIKHLESLKRITHHKHT